jgi:hypothetical protein
MDLHRQGSLLPIVHASVFLIQRHTNLDEFYDGGHQLYASIITCFPNIYTLLLSNVTNASFVPRICFKYVLPQANKFAYTDKYATFLSNMLP